ncbi:glycosyltransferase family 4 protein [Methylobacterium radiodurans]|uniref:Glycosyltransferase family 1 protein n=1 Tax=Methylobacterium radiodurans TaxID=2202828 RepID=A0A2U8VXZ6_9HYPH|nr:glycosyltransferase family 4 protein [Methylobacterium radiodurans]AWN38221.1 glycosyltransferase family 1 protein [Methylobacterium radiodurans]
MIRVLSAIVVPPHMSVSGGARAGEMLSAALHAHCRIDVASMMGSPEDPGPCGRLAVRTHLPPGLPWSRLPNRYRSLFYRSDIPGRVRGYDLVHLHNPMPSLEMARIARAARRAGVPYVISTHGFNEVANGGSIYGFGPARRALWRGLVHGPVAEAVRGAAGILALSPADFDIVRAMGFRDGLMEVVPNGVAVPEPADPGEDAILLARFALPAPDPAGPLTLMFLANHTPNKGLPVLLRSLQALRRPVQLIVGGETRPEIDYAGLLGALAPDQRVVVTGRLSDAEVGALMRRADLFVFPTLADTLPLVVFEAMAQGVPVLASAVGGIPYQIDPSCGQLVPPGDPAALAAAVERLGQDRSRLRRMGLEARARVATGFTWAAAASKAHEAYGRVLAASERATEHQVPPIAPARSTAAGR